MEIASSVPVAGLAALLDYDAPPWEGVPPLGHWLYFLNTAPQSTLGPDGHPKRDDALPLRRMWAGSRIEFLAPITVGATIEKHTRILATENKTGASGEMVFVTELHEVTAGGVLAVREERDVVYRGPGEAPPSKLAMPEPEFSRTLVPDATQLFRFSALTFNAHRIHYDRDYMRDIEHYPGLVVQGPYTAMLLMDLALRHGAKPARFAFRARRPHFEGRPLTLCGAAGRLWSLDDAGQTGMTAEIA